MTIRLYITTIILYLIINGVNALENESTVKQHSTNCNKCINSTSKTQIEENKHLLNLVNSECPSVVICGTADGAKQIIKAITHNRQANTCYTKNGDSEMANFSAAETTRCQTMLGSITPTIKNK